MGMWYCWCFFRENHLRENHLRENHGDSRNFSQPQLWRRTEALGRTWNKRLDFGSSWHTPWYVALVCNKKTSKGKFFPQKTKVDGKRDTMENTKKTSWGVRLCLWFVCFLGLVGVDGLRVTLTLGIFSSENPLASWRSERKPIRFQYEYFFSAMKIARRYIFIGFKVCFTQNSRPCVYFLPVNFCWVFGCVSTHFFPKSRRQFEAKSSQQKKKKWFGWLKWSFLC